MESRSKKTLLMSLAAFAAAIVFVSAGMAEEKTAASPATAASQPAAAQAKLEKFNGVIEKVDPAGREFVAQFHKETMTFSVGESTKFMEGSKTLPFSDLKKGMWANVEYQKEGTKTVAHLVNVGVPKAGAKTAASAQMKEGKKEGASEKATEKK